MARERSRENLRRCMITYRTPELGGKALNLDCTVDCVPVSPLNIMRAKWFGHFVDHFFNDIRTEELRREIPCCWHHTLKWFK